MRLIKRRLSQVSRPKVLEQKAHLKMEVSGSYAQLILKISIAYDTSTDPGWQGQH